MSRLEKTIQKKSKKKKLRFISKILFILFMSINLMVGIYIVDVSAKTMLGEKVYNIEDTVKNIQCFINEKFEYTNLKTKEILAKYNK